LKHPPNGAKLSELFSGANEIERREGRREENEREVKGFFGKAPRSLTKNSF